MKALIGFGLIVIMTLLVGTCSFEVIDPGHVGVKVRLGKVQDQVYGEGLQFKTPLIEKFKEVNARQFTVKQVTECPTSDSQLVTSTYTVRLRINPATATQAVNKFSTEDSMFDSLVAPTADTRIKQLIVRMRAEEALAKREEVAVALQEVLQKEIPDVFLIEKVEVPDIKLSPELREAIERKQVGEQQALAKEYDLKRAKVEAEITIENAKAEAEAIRVKGIAIKENPSVVNLDIVKKWDGKTPETVVVGGDSDAGANILLPIKPTK